MTKSRPTAVNGYQKPPRRRFALAPHHRLLRTGCRRAIRRSPDETGLKLLRDPVSGLPVVRLHGDLRPGEVSLVLE